MTTDTEATPIPSAGTPKRRSWLPWVIAIVALVIAGAVVVAVVATSDDNTTVADASLGTQQLASIQQACAQWRDGDSGVSVPPSAWCDDMVGWMTSQVRGGHMMGSKMWGDPDQMLATCQAWLATGATEPDGSAWCAQMIGWMTEHMGDWDQWDRGWMMNGQMMGG